MANQAYEAARAAVREWALLVDLMWAPGSKADALMGYAHGLEDWAYRLKGESNRARDEAEERDFSRLMAL